MIKEDIAKALFFICAFMSVICIGVITFFIFSKGVPAIFEIGIVNFLFGQKWSPSENLFGIFPMIVSSIIVTLCSFFLGSYIGKWSAIFLAFYCNKKYYKIIKSMIELLAGVPSVVYGFFGIVVIVPIVRDYFGGPGKSMLSAIIILTIMILPTIINLSETSLRAVPKSYYEGAVSLGATHHEAIYKVMLPAAKSGITASYVLGIGRALGETMAVILVSGNNAHLNLNFLKPIRTMTGGIALEMGYASGLHQDALFGIGVILFIFILILNIVLSKLNKAV